MFSSLWFGNLPSPPCPWSCLLHQTSITVTTTNNNSITNTKFYYPMMQFGLTSFISHMIYLPTWWTPLSTLDVTKQTKPSDSKPPNWALKLITSYLFILYFGLVTLDSSNFGNIILFLYLKTQCYLQYMARKLYS